MKKPSTDNFSADEKRILREYKEAGGVLFRPDSGVLTFHFPKLDGDVGQVEIESKLMKRIIADARERQITIDQWLEEMVEFHTLIKYWNTSKKAFNLMMNTLRLSA